MPSDQDPDPDSPLASPVYDEPPSRPDESAQTPDSAFQVLTAALRPRMPLPADIGTEQTS